MMLDLTHTLINKISSYPGTPSPLFAAVSTIEKDGFSELSMTLCSHTGTHIDAPSHIIAGAKSLDDFCLDRFIGSALVIDCSQLNEIGLTCLQENKRVINEVDFVLFYTGWQHKWNTESYFDTFPTLTEEATRWLSTFKLKGLGFDTISVDDIADDTLLNHGILLEKEILIIENMNNLDKLISQIFELNCIPLKIENSDASPVRAFARL